MDNHELLTILVVLIGISVLVQLVIMVGAAVSIVALRKAITSAVETTADLKATIVPMVHTTRTLIERVSPQVVSITGDVAEITKVVRKETADAKVSAHEVMERVGRQTQRLDSMLTTGLDGLERAGNVLESAVAIPVRQANGIFAAIKAVIDTYRSVSPGHSENRRANANGTKAGYAPSSVHVTALGTVAKESVTSAFDEARAVRTANGEIVSVAGDRSDSRNIQKDYEI